MEKKEVAKKVLSEKDYKIWCRVQVKKANEYPVIAKDLGISKQAVYTAYSKGNKLVNALYLLRQKNEEI